MRLQLICKRPNSFSKHLNNYRAYHHNYHSPACLPHNLIRSTPLAQTSGPRNLQGYDISLFNLQKYIHTSSESCRGTPFNPTSLRTSQFTTNCNRKKSTMAPLIDKNAAREVPMRENRQSTPVERITERMETSSLDDRSYRVIKLPNQLEVLLVHDPETDVSQSQSDIPKFI